MAVAVPASRLVADLLSTPASRWVRIVGQWLADGEVDDSPVALTGQPVVDALVAAATAQLARAQGLAVPGWTLDSTRFLDSFWQPSGPRFYAWSLTHAAEEFLLRGLLVEQNSLVSG